MDSEPLPRATVAKLVSEALPGGVHWTPDFVDLVSECASEFIHMVSAEAQEISQRGGKSTITPESIVAALKDLDFPELLDEVRAAVTAADSHAKDTSSAKRSKKLDKLGIPREELLAEQQRLFQKAKSALAAPKPP
eukprot:TRINITY_DN9450_c0_g1_i2.p1 TRINITY_DN9450_c0_g1~~TRINITY_DN9450_c0_g1_i2.p1  ORF type:complete len:136 (+),score=41.61 TRINITY_DN9450_c0_g1_i2:774-1181(+)